MPSRFGGDREGEYSTIILHYAEMKEAPHLVVYAIGDLADALHHFACIGPKGCLICRSIKVSGKIKIYKAKRKDETPIYNLDVRDWKAFQILPEPFAK